MQGEGLHDARGMVVSLSYGKVGSIPELTAAQQAGQQGEGGGGFAHPVAASQEVKGFHRPNSTPFSLNSFAPGKMDTLPVLPTAIL